MSFELRRKVCDGCGKEKLVNIVDRRCERKYFLCAKCDMDMTWAERFKKIYASESDGNIRKLRSKYCKEHKVVICHTCLKEYKNRSEGGRLQGMYTCPTCLKKKEKEKAEKAKLKRKRVCDKCGCEFLSYSGNSMFGFTVCKECKEKLIEQREKSKRTTVTCYKCGCEFLMLSKLALVRKRPICKACRWDEAKKKLYKGRVLDESGAWVKKDPKPTLSVCRSGFGGKTGLDTDETIRVNDFNAMIRRNIFLLKSIMKRTGLCDPDVIAERRARKADEYLD